LPPIFVNCGEEHAVSFVFGCVPLPLSIGHDKASSAGRCG